MTPTSEPDSSINATEIVYHTNHTIENADEKFELTKWEFIKYVWFVFHWLAMSQ